MKVGGGGEKEARQKFGTITGDAPLSITSHDLYWVLVQNKIQEQREVKEPPFGQYPDII
jgi:hypothetical protein